MNIPCITTALFSLLAWMASQPAAAEQIRVLILSGQNNHAWQETTPKLRRFLDESERCAVDVTEAPQDMTMDYIAGFDVPGSNWNAFVEEGVAEWPRSARTALLDFMKSGQGFASIYAGPSSFYDGAAYQDLVIASWRLGVTGHGPKHTFSVTPTRQQHPIAREIEASGLHDELWHNVPLRPGACVLAMAFLSKEQGGSGRGEPIFVTKPFGDGCSVNLLLGQDTHAMGNPTLGKLVARLVEWAATGSVSLPETSTPAEDHPSEAVSQCRKDKE